MKYLIIISMFITFSCNKAILVSRSKIIHETEGYLLYYRSDKCLFIPSKDASVDMFTSDTAVKRGYLLQSACGISGLKFTSQKFMVEMVYMDNGQEISIPDSIFITTTSFRYLLNKTRSIDIGDTLEFVYSGKRYKINASDSFYGEVLKVAGNAR